MSTDPSGWMPDIERVPTQAYGYEDIADDGMYCDAIVSHVAQGYMGGLIAMMQNPNPGKSWHFSIGRNGRIVQHVSIADPAWHAGDVANPTWPLHDGRNPNRRTVGIEHEGFSINPGYGYDYLYSQQNPWPEALIEASLKVHAWVFRRVNEWTPGQMAPGENTVITHSMLNTRTRAQDPGDLWLQTVRPRLIRALQGAPEPTPEPPPLVIMPDVDGAIAHLREAIVKLGG